MKRKVYYVIHCTSEENQNGIFHYSAPLKTEKAARYLAVQKRIDLGNGDGHVAVEGHQEVYEHYAWRLEGEVEQVDYL